MGGKTPRKPEKKKPKADKKQSVALSPLNTTNKPK